MGQHEVNVGARVKGRDGKKLGSVEQLIVHPGTYQIDGFILGKGFLSEPKIVNADLVTATDKEGIVLSMNSDEASELPTLIVATACAGRRGTTVTGMATANPECTPAPISGACGVRAAVNCRIPAVNRGSVRPPSVTPPPRTSPTLAATW